MASNVGEGAVHVLQEEHGVSEVLDVRLGGAQLPGVQRLLDDGLDLALDSGQGSVTADHADVEHIVDPHRDGEVVSNRRHASAVLGGF